jgi:hypothetical protein
MTRRGQDRRGRSKTGPPFVQLFRYLLSSEAWSSLSAQERSVYIVLAMIYNGSNNGCLGLSVREAAARANVSKDTAARALHTLQDRGFAACVTPGGFSRKTRHATEWRLTAYRCDRSGALPTKDFMKWRASGNPKPGPKLRHNGPKSGSLNGLDIENVL